MVVAGVAADTVRLQGEFLAEDIGYFAYFAYAFPMWPRAPQGCEEGLVNGIPAGHYTASKDNKAEMFRTGGGVTLLGPNGAWGKGREMPTSEKDLLAAEAIDRWEDFRESLSSEKRKYPIQQFRAFGRQQHATRN